MKTKLLSLILLLFSLPLSATEAPLIRFGALAFGTVNWELAALKQLPTVSDAYRLQVMPLATPQSGKIALQSGSVDMIVSDWVWVSRLRHQGADFTFYPYSETVGGLVVPSGSSIQQLTDLKGKKLGIAGGELDKNWLLLQALAQQQGWDLNQSVQKTYGAPPLLNQQLLQQRLDAVLTYWHFAARLQARGFRQLLNGQQILAGLGIQQRLPMLGYVFNRSWARQYNKALTALLTDLARARNLICSDDKTWQAIVPLTKSKQAAEQKLLRQRYCEGRVKHWSTEKQQAAQTVYKLLKKVSHNKLTGNAEHIAPDTFWSFKH